ncbi:MAG: DEAD/DEAH box helicase [Pseudomonadota bacterium]
MPEQMSLLGDPPKPNRRILTFDLETLRSAYDVGGWENLSLMGMACGVVHDSLDNQYHVYDEAQAAGLVAHLKKADLVVGFNHVGFDYGVLAAYTKEDLRSVTHNFDMLLDVTRLLGHRLKLNSLVAATLGDAKSADGMQSLQWVKEGKLDLVREYCKKDVEVTRRLFDYGVKEEKVFYYDLDGNSIQLRVDWDPESLIERAKKA